MTKKKPPGTTERTLCICHRPNTGSNSPEPGRSHFIPEPELEQINELTKKACDKTAQKYHDRFRNEMGKKKYDRLLLDKFSAMLPVGSAICDAGCGPSGHIGKYISDKGHKVTGIDISAKCIEIATSYNPEINFKVMDMMNTDFDDCTFDGIISYYSIIYTPKCHIKKIFREFNRILKKDGKLLLAVKKGTKEGIVDDEWYDSNKVYLSYFVEHEIKDHLENNQFRLDFFETRQPYNFEIRIDRIYAIGTKI